MSNKKHDYNNHSGFQNVYTDGSCSKNGRSSTKAGIGVAWENNVGRNVSAPVYGSATNNTGKIEAATRAIDEAGQMGISKLRVNTDSKFLIQAANEYMPKWKKNGWRTAGGDEVKNRNDFQRLDDAMRQNPNLEIEFKHVPAHPARCSNRQAARLAKQGEQNYRDGGY